LANFEERIKQKRYFMYISATSCKLFTTNCKLFAISSLLSGCIPSGKHRMAGARTCPQLPFTIIQRQNYAIICNQPNFTANYRKSFALTQCKKWKIPHWVSAMMQVSELNRESSVFLSF